MTITAAEDGRSIVEASILAAEDNPVQAAWVVFHADDGLVQRQTGVAAVAVAPVALTLSNDGVWRSSAFDLPQNDAFRVAVYAESADGQSARPTVLSLYIGDIFLPIVARPPAPLATDASARGSRSTIPWPAIYTATTDDSGFYYFVLPPADYAVAPDHPDYRFEPPERYVHLADHVRLDNFVADPIVVVPTTTAAPTVCIVPSPTPTVTPIKTVLPSPTPTPTPTGTAQPTQTPCAAVSGALTGDTVWPAGCVIAVEGSVNVDEGNSLTIEPGVTVKFNGPYDLLIGGVLDAKGAIGSPVVFTSGSADPQPGDWGEIHLVSSAQSSTLSNVTVEYADTGIQTELGMHEGGLFIDESLFHHNNVGITVTTPLKVTYSTFESNGVAIALTARQAVIVGSNFISNGVAITSTGIIDVQYSTFVGNTDAVVTLRGGGEFSNNIVRNNYASDIVLTVGGSFSARYNLIEANSSLTGILSTTNASTKTQQIFNRVQNNEITTEEGCLIHAGINADSYSLRYSHILSNTAVYLACTETGGNLSQNYWGITDLSLLEDKIRDADDDPAYGQIRTLPVFNRPVPEIDGPLPHPFVTAPLDVDTGGQFVFTMRQDAQNNTHIVFDDSKTVFYTNNLSGTFSTPIPVIHASGAHESLGVLAFEIDSVGNFHFVIQRWQLDDEYTVVGSSIYYLQSDGVDFPHLDFSNLQEIPKGAPEDTQAGRAVLRLDSENNAHIIFNSAQNYYLFGEPIYYTHTQFGVLTQPIEVDDSRLNMVSRLDLEIDSADQLHIIAVDDTYQGASLLSRIQYWRGDENGFTSTTVFSHNSDDFWGQIQGLDMALDPEDNVHIVFDLHDIYYLRSNEDGFTTPVFIDGGHGGRLLGVSPLIRPLPDNVLSVVYNTAANSGLGMRQIEYRDGDWQTPEIITEDWEMIQPIGRPTGNGAEPDLYFLGKRISCEQLQIYTARRK
ncbi:MAG: right-handed parallel beta-helix repeat-containing protein [Caldilineaceae bacterium]